MINIIIILFLIFSVIFDLYILRLIDEVFSLIQDFNELSKIFNELLKFFKRK